MVEVPSEGQENRPMTFEEAQGALAQAKKVRPLNRDLVKQALIDLQSAAYRKDTLEAADFSVIAKEASSIANLTRRHRDPEGTAYFRSFAKAANSVAQLNESSTSGATPAQTSSMTGRKGS